MSRQGQAIRARDTIAVQRAFLQEVPARLLLEELGRRVMDTGWRYILTYFATMAIYLVFAALYRWLSGTPLYWYFFATLALLAPLGARQLYRILRGFDGDERG